MKRLLTIALAFFVAIAAVSLGFTYNQVNQERSQQESNLQYRSSLLTDGLREAVEPNFASSSHAYLQGLVEKYSNRQRIAGLAVIDNKGGIVAMSSSLPKQNPDARQLATDVMDADAADGEFTGSGSNELYLYAVPLHETEGKKTSVVGALLVVQRASYINDQLADTWKTNLTRMFILTFLFVLAGALILRWVVIVPVQQLTSSLRTMRLGSGSATPAVTASHPLLKPVMSEISRLQLSLAQAQKAAGRSKRRSALESIDEPWTAVRLRNFTKDVLQDRTVVAVSNLEPYVHTRHGSKITWHVPASGLITAIEPVMNAMGGIWIAQGSGDADKAVVDEHDVVMVPPDRPKYKLKRVWLTQEEMNGYYYGFSDGALYPLSHAAHVRPTFRIDDWEEYKRVNEKFAKTVLKEIRNLKKPVIFVQDFQFTLLPRLIKKVRPDATVGLFWHIPWVSAEAFSICPWRKEILDGMLGADLLGFHTQLHCNNFIDTVGHELEALINLENFTVTRDQHVTAVRPFPVSIAFTDAADAVPAAPEPKPGELREQLLKPLGVDSKYIGFGVDRLDYIKGLAERFAAIDIFLERNPSMHGQFTFIQVAAPPETKSEVFKAFERQMDEKVDGINAKYGTRNWKPIVFIKRNHTHQEIEQYYKIANFCLVTSLHEGMNLVAKEYVASRADEKGVLILSQFAGASKELNDALVVNPYDAAQVAKAIRTAIAMPVREQTRRMQKLRNIVRNYNIYRWSAEFIKAIAELE